MNTERFNGMGKIYSKFRPEYPKELFDYLYSPCAGQPEDSGAGLSKESIIADIGSGTGKFTRALLERGSRVFAVEPNEDMRRVAEQDLREFCGFVSLNGTDENTGLDDKSVDFVMAAQAFHWFNKENFRAECRRILKTDGKVILVYNSRDEKSELVKENYKIMKKYCPGFKGFAGGMGTAAAKDEFDKFFIGAYAIKEFNNNLSFDEEGFIGRSLSGSYSPKEGDEAYSGFIKELKILFKKFSNNGLLEMPNFTRSYAGKV
jgi:SAM-dependent methyltransferase